MDELFGNIFDLNNDGLTDSIELALGFQIMAEMDDESSNDEDND